MIECFITGLLSFRLIENNHLNTESNYKQDTNNILTFDS